MDLSFNPTLWPQKSVHKRPRKCAKTSKIEVFQKKLVTFGFKNITQKLRIRGCLNFAKLILRSQWWIWAIACVNRLFVIHKPTLRQSFTIIFSFLQKSAKRLKIRESYLDVFWRVCQGLSPCFENLKIRQCTAEKMRKPFLAKKRTFFICRFLL